MSESALAAAKPFLNFCASITRTEEARSTATKSTWAVGFSVFPLADKEQYSAGIPSAVRQMQHR
jgi:hypothetical protein